MSGLENGKLRFTDMSTIKTAHVKLLEKSCLNANLALILLNWLKGVQTIKDEEELSRLARSLYIEYGSFSPTERTMAIIGDVTSDTERMNLLVDHQLTVSGLAQNGVARITFRQNN